MNKTCSTRKVWLPKHGQWVHFTHRDTMVRKRPMARATMLVQVPATILPVDCTGNATVSCPMDGNDKLGICGPAMCDHVDGIRTYGQGKTGFTELHANLTSLEWQYEQVSGGDNGTDEDMLVGASGVWTSAGGGLAGDPTAVVVDHLDVDVTDVPLTDYCIDQFYAVCTAWSVPDDFIANFAQGTSWLAADTPDPANGHFSPLSDIDPNGNYRLWTWGSWCWVGPAFIASVQPQSFVTFSALQFSRATGYDSHGRHVSDQAAAWVALGGNQAAVSTIVSQFPAKAALAAPATLINAQAWVANGIDATGLLTLSKAAAIAAANAGLAAHWPK